MTLRRDRGFALHCLVVCTLSFGAVTAGATDDYTVDQSNDGGPADAWYNIEQGYPIGQEFTPALDHLDVVELWTADEYSEPSEGADLYVTIHHATISAPSVATSPVVHVPDGFQGPTRFEFPLSVPLVPGELYVIQVHQADGFPWYLGNDWDQGDSYSGGRWVYMGTPVESVDTWFREGAFVVSTPVGDSSWGRIKALYSGAR
jgi:hypothetical protein